MSVRTLSVIWTWWLVAAAVAPAADPPIHPTILNAAPALGTDAGPSPAEVGAGRADGGEAASARPESQPAAETTRSDFERRPIGGGPADGSGGDTAGGSIGGWLGPTWWALILVIGLVFLGAYAIKRWVPGRMGGRGEGPFRVLSRWHLSARQYVALIQVGRRMLLIGVTGQQISLLADISDPAEIEQLMARCPQGRSALSEGFGQLLGRKRAEMTDGLDEATESDEPPASTGRAMDQLARLLRQVRLRLSRLRYGSGRQG